MKKFLILLFLMAIGTSAFARKSYVNVAATDVDSDTKTTYIYITGDVPSGIGTFYDYKMKVGTILNMLSQNGYEVEFMSAANSGSSGSLYVNYLLSKKSSSNEEDAITIVHNDDGDVREIARYNLQGMQVNENTKGIQIIVYSNYTTKTVIVE